MKQLIIKNKLNWRTLFSHNCSCFPVVFAAIQRLNSSLSTCMGKKLKMNRNKERLNMTSGGDYEVSKKMTMAISTLICLVVKTFCLYGRQFIFPTTSFLILIQIMILIKSSYDRWWFVRQLGGFTPTQWIFATFLSLCCWTIDHPAMVNSFYHPL